MIDFYFNLNSFHFIRPELLLLLLPALAGIAIHGYRKAKNDPWRQVCEPYLLQAMRPEQTQSWLKSSAFYGLLLAWLIAIFALAGPSWKRLPVPLYKNPARLVIALDLSPLMLAEDLKPSRIARARFKILDLIHQFDGQIGLVAFASESYVVSPLSSDGNTLASMVPDLNPGIMPVQGSDLRVAMQKAAQLLRADGQTHSGNILIITANAATEADLSYAAHLAKQGLHISVLGVGTTTGAPVPLGNGSWLGDNQGSPLLAQLNANSLAQLAHAGHGIYLPFSEENRDINTYLQHLSAHHFQQAALKTHVQSFQWQDQGYLFIWTLLPLVLWLFWRRAR